MEIIEKQVSELIPYEQNPRNNDSAVDYVANSIREYGFKVPIVIDENNVIVAGHTRLKAAKKIGFSTVPCVYVNGLSEDEINAYRIADNRTAEFAGWKMKLLDEELKELCDFDMSQFGFAKLEVAEESGPEEKDKKIKMVKCPHCGQMLEAKKVKIKHE